MVVDVQDLQNYTRDAFCVFAESVDASFDLTRRYSATHPPRQGSAGGEVTEDSYEGRPPKKGIRKLYALLRGKPPSN